MREDEVRIRLAKQLKRDDLPNAVWKTLVSNRLVADYLEDEIMWEDFVGFAETQLEAYRLILEELGMRGRGGGSGKEKKSKTVELHLGAYEKLRAAALGEYLALSATLDTYVQWFRQEYLGGEILSPEWAHHFANSPANAYFSLEWFEEKGIHPSAHLSRYLADGLRKTASEGFGRWYHHIRIYPADKVYEKTTEKPVGDTFLRFPYATEGYGPSRSVRSISVEEDSVLSELRVLSLYLVRDCCHYAWEEAQAAWFVLTGEAPPANALTARVRASYGSEMSNAQITLDVQPWAPVETVVRAYREIQQSLLGRDNRKISERALSLFRFVVGELRGSIPADGLTWADSAPLRSVMYKAQDLSFKETKSQGDQRKPSWRRLQERWNRAYPRWAYTDERNFYRAFYNAANLVVNVDYDKEFMGLEEEKDHVMPWLDTQH